VFVPAGQRSVAEAWFTLLQELYESAWGGSDPTPGLAKLAWWHEELEGWAKGARRHPLGELLQRQPVPWSALGRSLNMLPATRGQPAADTAAALTGLATAVWACEAALFAVERQQPAGPADPGAGTIVLLGERALIAGPDADTPWLLDRWPSRLPAARPRRIHAALLRARLAALSPGQPPAALPGWRVLAMSWRAARSG
ncbi:MAG: phytoene/squalene synthase family protein, partial [Gammaproteobacteria bacterium]|nr:phytoene/squalene synthase family protein [Gammaproteobacteria bacterium]